MITDFIFWQIFWVQELIFKYTKIILLYFYIYDFITHMNAYTEFLQSLYNYSIIPLITSKKKNL